MRTIMGQKQYSINRKKRKTDISENSGYWKFKAIMDMERRKNEIYAEYEAARLDNVDKPYNRVRDRLSDEMRFLDELIIKFKSSLFFNPTRNGGFRHNIRHNLGEYSDEELFREIENRSMTNILPTGFKTDMGVLNYVEHELGMHVKAHTFEYVEEVESK